jgi:hypothetical protein
MSSASIESLFQLKVRSQLSDWSDSQGEGPDIRTGAQDWLDMWQAEGAMNDWITSLLKVDKRSDMAG